MKIPFFPYCIVSVKFLKEVETSAQIKSKQIAKLIGSKHDMIQYIKCLPAKYWPKKWRAGAA